MSEPVRGGMPEPGFYALSGTERARAYLRGLVPRSPLSHLVGCRVTQVGSGSATVTMPASPWLDLSDGTLDVKIAMEEALALAVLTAAPPGSEVRTATLSVKHLRPCTPESETLIARARTLNSGAMFTVAEVTVEDALGRSLAHATSSAFVRSIDPPPPAPNPLEPVEQPTYPSPDPYQRPLARTVPNELWDEVDGLSATKAFFSGDPSPMPLLALLGGCGVDASDGSVTIRLRANEWLCSRGREVSPGVLAAVSHLALCAAAMTLQPGGYRIGLLEQDMSFLRSVSADGRDLVVKACVELRGEPFVVEVKVTDAEGNYVANGHQTSLLYRRSRKMMAEPDRALLSVLLTDIVRSTEHAAELGDAKWKELLVEHDALVRRQLEVFKGREVKMTGDGFLAAFDSPAQAVQCARVIRDGVRRLGLEIRAGIHTGECERRGGDLAGIAVHFASRIEAAAGPGEILVSSTVRDLVAGSRIQFADRGLHELKGIEEKRQLFAVED